MKLLFIRHGQAFAKKKNQTDMDDYFRPLVEAGIRQSQEQAQRELTLLQQMDVLYTSPLLRAVETAEIFLNSMPEAEYEMLASLDKLHSPAKFVQELIHFPSDKNYAFVGHEPHLSTSIQILLGNKQKIELAKSGMLLLSGRSFTTLSLTSLINPANSVKSQK